VFYHSEQRMSFCGRSQLLYGLLLSYFYLLMLRGASFSRRLRPARLLSHTLSLSARLALGSGVLCWSSSFGLSLGFIVIENIEV
jgi:hypothetical protein